MRTAVNSVKVLRGSKVSEAKALLQGDLRAERKTPPMAMEVYQLPNTWSVECDSAWCPAARLLWIVSWLVPACVISDKRKR